MGWCFGDLIDVTLADEDAFSKVFEVAADVENEESFRHSFNNDTWELGKSIFTVWR